MASGVKIMNQNFISLSILANTDVSSQQAAFPVTNAYDLNRRSKVWRSNGYFKVTSSNNQIVFRTAVGGPDIIASIPVSNYSSTSSLMAAISTVMHSVDTANYSVTQTNTFKFQIVSDLSGGATAFELRCNNVNFTAAGLLGFSTASNKTSSTTYTSDFLTINSQEFVLWDMGISTNPSHFIMCGPRNRALKLSPGGTFTLQGNHTNDFTNPIYSKVLTYDDEIISVLSDTSLAPVALRYWRILFMDQNPLGYIEIGAFFLGNSFEPVRGRAQFPLDSNFVDRSTTVVSEGGQTFSEVKDQTEDFKVVWSGLTSDEMNTLREHFRSVGKGLPWFVSLDTYSAFSMTPDRMLKFVKYVQEPTFQLISPNNFSGVMQLREEL